MELPDCVVQIIREYSRPVTRPDWRKLRRMNEYSFHHNLVSTYNIMNLPVLNQFVDRYEQIKHAKYTYLRYNYHPNSIAYVFKNKE